jgi:hypothetical protein
LKTDDATEIIPLLSASKKRICFILFSLLLVSFLSCKKDTEIVGTGTVIAQSGCYADTWLVAIDNPDFSKQPFLRSTVLTCTACYTAHSMILCNVFSLEPSF